MSDALKNLNSLELEVLYIDKLYKTCSEARRPDISTDSLLYLYLAALGTLRSYEQAVEDYSKDMLHKDVIDFLFGFINDFMKLVAKDESKASYVQQSLFDFTELVKSHLLVLKKELVASDKYAEFKV